MKIEMSEGLQLATVSFAILIGLAIIVLVINLTSENVNNDNTILKNYIISQKNIEDCIKAGGLPKFSIQSRLFLDCDKNK